MITTTISIDRENIEDSTYRIFCNGAYLGDIEATILAADGEVLGTATYPFQHNQDMGLDSEKAWVIMKDYLVNTEKCEVTD